MIATVARRERAGRSDVVPICAGQGRAYGTCGELVQGRFKDGVDFLITLPINLQTEARVWLYPERTIVVKPPGKVKTAQAARLALDVLGWPERGARITIASALPEGKGMASSTADIVATCRAIAAAVGSAFSPEQISAIARQIEPSDGVMHDGCVCYDHRRCLLLESLGPFPPATLLVADLGGRVDTVAFNRRPKSYTPTELDTLERAYDLAVAGIGQQRLSLLGQAATLSARTNQRLLPKPRLDSLLAVAKAYGAHGVCVAHSGTVAGLLFNPEDALAARAASRVLSAQHEGNLSLSITTSAGACLETECTPTHAQR